MNRFVIYIQLLAVTTGLAGCRTHLPPTFVAEPAGWKAIELREELVSDYESAWQVAVDSVAMEWDIEVIDKSSGYLRTAWKYTINKGAALLYGNRVTLKFSPGKVREKLMVKTEAIWTRGNQTRYGFDTVFNRDSFSVLQGRLSRTVK